MQLKNIPILEEDEFFERDLNKIKLSVKGESQVNGLEL